MKKKDIEKKLLEAASRVDLPSDLEETYRLVKQIPPEVTPSAKKKPFPWKWAVPSAAALSCVLALAIVIPSVLGDASPGEGPGSSALVPPTPLPGEMTEAEAGAISRQAVALFALAPSFEELSPTLSLARRMERFERDEEADSFLTLQEKEEVANEIEDFIYMVEEIQTSGAWHVAFDPSSSLITVEGAETFLISYSEEVVDASTQLFSGTISYEGEGGSSFAFEGRIETEGEETNINMDLEVPGGFIRVEQEIEAAEDEYRFSFYKEGDTRPYREIEYESEIEGREGESQIQVREGASTVECEFEYQPSSPEAALGDEFMCEYASEGPDGELEAEVFIAKIEGGHSYRFAGDGTPIEIVR